MTARKIGTRRRALSPVFAAVAAVALVATLGAANAAFANDAPEHSGTITTDTVANSEAAQSADETATDSDATVSKSDSKDPYAAKKVFVCKYVGTPGVDERLKEGKNPISVAVNAIQNNQWDGTVPGWFSDKHDRSYVAGYDTGQPAPACPGPEEPPFNWDWAYPAPTCDGLTVVYPGNIPAGSDHKDVNIRVKNLVTGEVRTFNFHDSNFDTKGQTVTYDVTKHPEWPGWTYFEYQWSQVHGTNFHWEGSVICGTAPPVEEVCVKIANTTVLNAAVDWKTGKGTITGTLVEKKTNVDKGMLCDGVATRSTAWSYAEVEKVWPQGLPKAPARFNDFTIEKLGAFTLQIPDWTGSCEQGDFYAQLLSKGGYDALKLPDTLTGPGKPFEPLFISQILKGITFDPYYQGSAKGCNVPEEENPVEVTGSASFEVLSCTEGSKNAASASGVKDGVFTFTDKNGDSFATKVGEGYEGGVPEGLAYGKIVVTLRDAGTDDLTKVVPWDGTWTPVNPDDLECVGEPTPVMVTGGVYTEVKSCTAGSKNLLIADAVEDGVWTATDEAGNTFVTKVGEGYEGGLPEGLNYGLITIVLSDAGTDDMVEVVAHDATWTPVNPDDLECVVKDADAWVNVTTAATCTEDAVADYKAKNATAEGKPVKGETDDSWVQKFVADKGHAFKDGSTSKLVSYTIEKATGFQSDDPKAPCYKAPTKELPVLPMTGSTPIIIGLGSVIGLGLIALGIMAMVAHRRRNTTEGEAPVEAL